MSRPDDRAALEVASVRKRLKGYASKSRKARIAEGIALYEAETGRRIPEGLKPAELLERINPALKRAGYLETELPKVRQVHQARTGK